MSEKILYEEKFLVINYKHLNQLSEPVKRKLDDVLQDIAMELNIEKKKYFVCNQDEPYADKIIKIILDGEKEKKETGN